MNALQENLMAILQELQASISLTKVANAEALVDAIVKAPTVYLAGAGRSGVAIRAFASRLMHLGKYVYVIGDVTTPHTHPNDLLIIGSGSGETASLVALAQKAKRSAVQIGLITIDPESTIAQLADMTLVLPGDSPKVQHDDQRITSIQPMGSSFEQLCFLTYDALVLMLMKQMNETSAQMFERHADLE